MDLGKAKLLRSGLNALYKSIHPVHGLAWTDGRQIVLTALNIDDEEPTFGNSVVIGQFEHVHGLCWGPVFANDIPALLAVQHKKHVSIWQVCYNTLENSKLVVSQTCEVRDPFPVLSQGCVWHPSKDILVILTKRDASILYSARYNNNIVKADIKSTGVIRCASWTKDGFRLILAIDSFLHSYYWDDVQKTLNPCSFCPVFDIHVNIYTVEPMTDYQVAVTAENTKETLSYSQKDIDGSSLQSSLLIFDEELSKHARRMSIESGRSEPVSLLKSSTLVPEDLTEMLSRHRKSDPNPMIPRKQIHIGNKVDSSYLIIVSFEKNATSTRKVNIPGISVPDILVLDTHAQMAIIASNSCNLVLVYPIAPASLPNIQQIKLGENEKSKGVCVLKNSMLLILVGKQKSNDVTFLSSSCIERYTTYLLIKELTPMESISPKFEGGKNITLERDSSFSEPGNTVFCDNQTVSKELLIPNNIGCQSPSVRRRFGQVIRSISCEQSPTSSLSDLNENKIFKDSVTLEKFDEEPTKRTELKLNQATPTRQLTKPLQKLCLNDVQETSRSLGNTLLSCTKDKVTSVTETVGNTNTNVVETLCCFSKFQEFMKDYMKTNLYPSCNNPQYISLVYQNSSAVGVSNKRSILLSHGKLQLRTVREIFSLINAEMKFGSMWIVLTEDGDGFIPITFNDGEEFVIRDAKDCNDGGSSEYCAILNGHKDASTEIS